MVGLYLSHILFVLKLTLKLIVLLYYSAKACRFKLWQWSNEKQETKLQELKVALRIQVIVSYVNRFSSKLLFEMLPKSCTFFFFGVGESKNGLSPSPLYWYFHFISLDNKYLAIINLPTSCLSVFLFPPCSFSA